MSKLWIKFKTYSATQVSTADCQNVDDFLKACKKELLFLYGQFPPGELSLSTTEGGSPLEPDDPIPAPNTAKTPLFISVEEQTLNEIATVRSDEAVSDFWNAFKNCSDPIQENQVIQLPRDVFILGNPIIGSSIFIRPCYPKLLEIVFSIIKDPATPHLVILGTPGIGKTFFGYVILLYLARTGATVVYERGRENARYLFSANGIFTGSRNDFIKFLKLPNTFYIVDAVNPVDVAAKTVLLSSLRRDGWYQFSKEKCTTRYMPVWSWEEIQICRGLLFDHLTSAETKSLYDMWGGIARYVLENARNTPNQELLWEAFGISNINSILESLGGTGEKADASSRLIHASVESNFRVGPYQFASAYVAEEFYKRVYLNDRDCLIRFLSASQGMSTPGQLRGIFFEQHAHAVIGKGGAFKIRDLKTNGESTLNLPMDLSRFLYSSNNLEFQLATHHYFRPKTKIFESIDSFIKPNLLFQMTIYKNYPCRQTGLRNVLETLGNPVNPELYFVVPPDIFPSFTYQNYIGKDGKVLSESGIVGSVRELSQFVLTFELCSQYWMDGYGIFKCRNYYP